MPTLLRARVATGALTATAALVLAGCASGQPAASAGASSSAAGSTSAQPAGAPRITLTYDGGLLVLNSTDLSTVADLTEDGFLRVNSAGDPDGHVMVTTPEGFQVLDTGLTSGNAELTDVVFPASEAGHVTPHAGTTALFADGTGDITLFDTDAVNAASLPPVRTVTSEAAHHGVAIELSNGQLLATIGTQDGRSGVRVLDASGTEIARNEDCPAVHGEGALRDEVVMFGCENGVLLYKDGAFVKLPAPDAYGRTGNAYVTDTSAIAVGDYRNDPDMEGYLLSSLVFVDTAAQTSTVVPLPDGVSYTWRGVDRDADDDVIVLSSDGRLYRLDLTGAVVASWPVIAPWTGPAKWQDPHPALTVVGETAYITEPAGNRILAFDLVTGTTTATGTLDHTPNEIAIVGT